MSPQHKLSPSEQRNLDLALQISLLLSAQHLEDIHKVLRLGGDWKFSVNVSDEARPFENGEWYRPYINYQPAGTALVFFHRYIAGMVAIDGTTWWNPHLPGPRMFMRAVARTVSARLCSAGRPV